MISSYPILGDKPSEGWLGEHLKEESSYWADGANLNIQIFKRQGMALNKVISLKLIQ